MIPIEPKFTTYNTAEEPWRVARLIRTDGRARELLRIITGEAVEGVGSEGEQIWTQHVLRLHDERGTLCVHITAALGASGWLSVIASVLARAWDGEDEGDVDFFVEEETVPWPLKSVLIRP
ncbi:hypothetical protein [Belnapia moabensis]|uniref:hypothetical protein n=1 Tax=Belnapia moabensis TaxID=365533 RepID=UPI0005BC8337|nr:hypothetical protein [Belnapia moabensis]